MVVMGEPRVLSSGEIISKGVSILKISLKEIRVR